MVKIFNEIKNMDEYSVIFEPELFIAMTIKHVDRKFPTCLLYPTGSYKFLGVKMEIFKGMYKTFKFSLFPPRKVYEPVGYNKHFLSTCLIVIAMNNYD